MNTRNQEIAKRFKDSWKDTLLTFDKFIEGGFEKLIPVRLFIQELDRNEQWKFFRIGTSMDSLIFSRSVDFGLRIDQKYLCIKTVTSNEYEIVLRSGNKRFREYKINDLKDIRLKKLLNTLKKTLID